ncbi:MAG: protein kinase, partial [bacterium]|nr:protein kinase [bacterium]
MNTILLLEAHAKHAEIIGEHFKKRKFTVLTSPSTTGFKAIIEKEAPDFLVIDLNATGPDDLTFYQWIKETPSIAGLPCVFIADKPQQELATKLEKNYKESVLYKPLSIDKVVQVFQNRQSQLKTALISNKNTFLASLAGKKIGPAVIGDEIGRGGMGTVFMGYQESLKRQVAVKILLPGMLEDPSATQRFKREAQTTAQLKSPHIVQIYDFGEFESHVFYIIMEYLQGETLEKHLDRNGRFSQATAVSIIMQIARGLLVAHDAGLVHRDIKSSNLILNSKGQVTITDFGLVRAQSMVKHTRTGMLVGTPHYLSPEQISGATPDLRSDIYSLGIVFYEMLVGAHPFNSNSTIEVLMMHMNTPMPDPRKVVPEISWELVDIIKRMTAKEPASRYSDCREIFKAIEEANKKYTFSDKMRTNDRKPISEPRVKKVPLPITFVKSMEELEKEYPSLIAPDKLKGSLVLTPSGGILGQEGEVPDNWKNALYALHESAMQLNRAARLGAYRFNIITTQEEILTLAHQEEEGSAKPNLKAMLFKQDRKTISNFSLKNHTEILNGGHTTSTPTQSIAAVAGIRDVLLFDIESRLQESSVKNPD